MKLNLNKKTVALIAAAAVVVLLLFCFGGPTVRGLITDIFKSAVGIEDTTPTPEENGLVTNPPDVTNAPTDTPAPTEEITAEPTPTDEPDNTPTPTNKPTNTPKPTKAPTPTQAAYKSYYFRNKTLLDQHFEKHGNSDGMHFKSAAEYEKAASDVINNPKALHKTEKDDGDYVYYVVETNEFVILSKDGYIRTYFLPSAGKAYYDRQ